MALDLLARREHSRRELQTKLTLRDFPNDDIAAALDRLEEDGLLSDQRFAEAYVRQRVAKGYGPLRIRQELRERGVDDGLIAEALAPWAGQWLEVAAAQHDKHFGRQPEDRRERARQNRYLQNRGFDFDVIRAIISD